MKDEITFLGLTPFFALAGALATAIAWQVFALTLSGLVPDQLEVLCCLIAGLTGPLAAWALLWLATRGRLSPLARAYRRAASVGFGLVVAAEVGFYIPLGFFAVAFH